MQVAAQTADMHCCFLRLYLTQFLHCVYHFVHSSLKYEQPFVTSFLFGKYSYEHTAATCATV